MYQRPALHQKDAARILEAAEAEALKNDWSVSIAVCDEGGHLLTFSRADGANSASAQIAQAKAQTAALLQRETKAVEAMINGGRFAFLSAPGMDGFLEGGIPLNVGGHCVGAVGVSGVQPGQDHQSALAAASGLEHM